MAKKKGGEVVIAEDFEYYRPDSLDEAVETYLDLESSGKKPMYYGGGTEIITMCRAGSLSCGAVVDLKGIQDCVRLGLDGDNLFVGAGVTLTDIDESKEFPALGAACARVADHSVQGKITLGGNLAGTIIYREAALPLLLCDAVASVAGPDGRLDTPFKDVFSKGRLALAKGEFLVGVIIPRQNTEAPWFHTKRTKMEEIGYPLLTLVALKLYGQVRLAVSGMYQNPMRLPEVEKAIQERRLSIPEKVSGALEQLPSSILDDLSGSAEYRRFIMGRVLSDCFAQMEAS